MGHPLPQNINANQQILASFFKRSTNERSSFDRFPVQVAVIYSARQHSEFALAFEELFLELDQITAHHVVFFALLDPPLSWLQTEHGKRWASKNSIVGTRHRLSADDDVIVREIAKTFSVSWDELPVLVASPNLWLGQHCVVKTDAQSIIGQIQALVDLVKKLGRPDLPLIRGCFQEKLGIHTVIHKKGSRILRRLINAYAAYNSVIDGSERAATLLYRTLNETSQKLSKARDHYSDDENEVYESRSNILEESLGEVALIATLAQPHIEHYSPQFDSWVDAESAIFLETTLRIDSALGTSTIGDYTNVACGLWKALELEVNLSIIQAARKSRGVEMPHNFAKYDPKLEPLRSEVQLGKFTVSINQLDRRRMHIDNRHRFLELGKSLGVFNVLDNEHPYEFRDILEYGCGHPFPRNLINQWDEIVKIRNRGSHTEPIDLNSYNKVKNYLLKGELLPTLAKVKSYLRGEPNQNLRSNPNPMQRGPRP